MSRTATWFGFAIGSTLYYIFIGGTANELVLQLLSGGTALSLHWILNR